MKKVKFFLVNLCTCINMFAGMLSMYFTVLGEYFWAACALLFSVVFDAADGFLARKWGVPSEFGAQLDSLADFASFCFAGGTLSFYWLGRSVPQYEWVFGLAGALYVCLGGIRLARYNANTDSVCPPSFFEGMPTTAASCILAIICIGTPGINPWIGLALTVALAYLMVCRLPYPKLTKMTFVPKWVWLVPFICGAFFFAESIWVFSMAYLASGIVFALFPKLRPS